MAYSQSLKQMRRCAIHYTKCWADRSRLRHRPGQCCRSPTSAPAQNLRPLEVPRLQNSAGFLAPQNQGMGKGACCRKSTVEVGGLTQRNALILRGLPCLEANWVFCRTCRRWSATKKLQGYLPAYSRREDAPRACGGPLHIWVRCCFLVPWLHEVCVFGHSGVRGCWEIWGECMWQSHSSACRKEKRYRQMWSWWCFQTSWHWVPARTASHGCYREICTGQRGRCSATRGKLGWKGFGQHVMAP